jgi:hypothetical protein
MHGFQKLLERHALPSLEVGEKVETSALLYSGAMSRKYFVAAATKKALILVEAEVGLLKAELAYKMTRRIPYRAISSVKSRGFLNQKRLILRLHSGELMRFGLNTLLSGVADQSRFIPEFKKLYAEYIPEAEPLPTALAGGEIEELELTDTGSARPQLPPRFGFGVLAGAIAAAVAAVAWAAITVITESQISWMAIGVGAVVGTSVHTAGRGNEKRFGFAAGSLALAACVVGNFLWAAYFFARGGEVPFLEGISILARFPGLALEVMRVAFNPTDLLFYAIAAYVGFRLAFDRQATPAIT